jgi:hypothetical protein
VRSSRLTDSEEDHVGCAPRTGLGAQGAPFGKRLYIGNLTDYLKVHAYSRTSGSPLLARGARAGLPSTVARTAARNDINEP